MKYGSDIRQKISELALKISEKTGEQYWDVHSRLHSYICNGVSYRSMGQDPNKKEEKTDHLDPVMSSVSDNKDNADDETILKETLDKLRSVIRQELFLTRVVKTHYNEDRTKVMKREFIDGWDNVVCFIEDRIKMISVSNSVFNNNILGHLSGDGPKINDRLLVDSIKDTAQEMFGEDFSEFRVKFFGSMSKN